MSPFERAITEESKWLAYCVEQPFPADPRAGHRIYIGPTLLPVHSQLRYLDPFTSDLVNPESAID